MQFKFYPTESRIIDLLGFPECIEFGKAHREELENNNYSDLLPEDNLKLFKDMEEVLKPYEVRIYKFYFEECSIPRLLSRHYSPFGYISSEDYLAFIQSLDEDKLRRSFISKLYDIEYDNTTIDEEILNDLANNTGKQIDFLEKLQLSDDEKWKLSKILRQPKEMILEWSMLIKELEPLFNKFYNTKEAEIITLGNRMVEELNKSNGDAISEMSNNLVKRDLLPNGNILISLINAYSIELNTTSNVEYIKWGLYIEDLIESIKDAQENAIRERVILFKNLGDKTRYEVVRLIGKGVESSKEIAEILGVSQATISYHISNLTASKIIELEKNEGKYNYKVNLDFLKEVYELMIEDFTNGRQNL